MAFCFVVGCNEGFDQTNDGIARICPRCHNASIVGGMKKTYLEFCFIPISFAPISKKQTWMCPVCQWFVDASRGEPQRVGAYQPSPAGPGGPPGAGAYFGPGVGGNPPQPGYGPSPGMVRPQGSGGVAGQYPGR